MRGLSLADIAYLANATPSGVPGPPVTAGLVLRLSAELISQSNGTPINTWNDASGAGNHFTQPLVDPTQAPTYTTGQQNGKAGAFFDGTNDHLTHSGPVTTNTTYSIFAVMRHTSAVGLGVVFQNGNLNGYLMSKISNNREITHRGIASCADGACTTNTELWTAIRTSAPALTFRVNAAGQSVSNSTSGCNAPDSLSAVGIFTTFGSFFFTGYLFELLVYDVDLNNTDRDAVEAYLNGRWAVY